MTYEPLPGWGEVYPLRPRKAKLNVGRFSYRQSRLGADYSGAVIEDRLGFESSKSACSRFNGIIYSGSF